MNRTTEPSMQANQAADAYARRLTARLTHGNADLPYDITERLRAARMQALAQRKRPAIQTVQQTESATQARGWQLVARSDVRRPFGGPGHWPVCREYGAG